MQIIDVSHLRCCPSGREETGRTIAREMTMVLTRGLQMVEERTGPKRGRRTDRGGTVRRGNTMMLMMTVRRWKAMQVALRIWTIGNPMHTPVFINVVPMPMLLPFILLLLLLPLLNHSIGTIMSTMLGKMLHNL